MAIAGSADMYDIRQSHPRIQPMTAEEMCQCLTWQEEGLSYKDIYNKRPWCITVTQLTKQIRDFRRAKGILLPPRGSRKPRCLLSPAEILILAMETQEHLPRSTSDRQTYHASMTQRHIAFCHYCEARIDPGGQRVFCSHCTRALRRLLLRRTMLDELCRCEGVVRTILALYQTIAPLIEPTSVS